MVSISNGSAAPTSTVTSFFLLGAKNDGLRNLLGKGSSHFAEHILVDRAQLLNLGAPEMTVLVGGLRVLGVSNDGHGVFTNRVGTLSNDFFVNLMDQNTAWSGSSGAEDIFEGTIAPVAM